MSEKQHSGLIANNAQVPLQGVRIEGKVTGLCSEVTVTQRYFNAEAVDVEAVYVFPLEEGSAVCGFTAKVGDRVIRGRAEEREKAFEVYDDAMAAGHGAFLLDQERPNIFTASVGNLKPKQTIEIAITYVALLNFEGPAIRLMIPTTISPRYVPATAPTVGEPDGERVNPPTQDSVPYGLTLQVDLTGKLQSIDSPSHPIRTTFQTDKTVVTLSSDEVALDRDFVLLVQPADAHQPQARVAREADGTQVAMVTFHPDPTGIPHNGNEVLFLLDCSGSMQGDSIEQAKRALALCVRALTELDTFNIVYFGSSFRSLWPTPQAYNQANLEAATQSIQTSSADLGGTEILQPLRHLLQSAADPKRARQILLLTDGEVSNEADVIEACKQHQSTARVFSFGIGAGASEHLVRSVARVSRGAAEFIYPGERIEPKVLRMFGRVNTPSVKNVVVDWLGLDVEQAPASTPAIFGGDSVTVFARIKSGTSNKVVLRADEHSWEIPLDLGQAETAGPIPTLWARQTVRDLEAGHGAPRQGSAQGRRSKEDRTQAKLVELGVRYGLMTSATSYVAVEERTEADKTQGQAQLRKVPIALTRGWHGRGLVGGGGSASGMARAAAMPSVAPAVMRGPVMPSPAMMPAPPPPPAPTGMAPGSGYLGGQFADFGSFSLEAGEAPEFEADLRDDIQPEPMEAPAKSRGGLGGVVGRLFSGSKKKEKADARKMAPAPAMKPKPEAARAKQDESSDFVFDLLMTQQADGSFRLGDVLQRRLGSRWAAVRAAADQHGEALVATTIVLALLAKEAADRSDEWKPAAAKAMRWLSQQNSKFDAGTLI